MDRAAAARAGPALCQRCRSPEQRAHVPRRAPGPAHAAAHLRSPSGSRPVADRDLARSASRRPRRAAPSPAASRTPGPSATAPSSGFAAHRAHRTRDRSAARACAVAAPSARTRLASRACHGQAPRPSGTRAPRQMSSRPPITGAATRGSSRGSSEPSQSMKQTSSDSAACRPAKHAGAEPAARLAHDASRRAHGRSQPSRRSSRCRRRAGGSPPGTPPSTCGSACASSSAGRITSITDPILTRIRLQDRNEVLTRWETGDYVPGNSASQRIKPAPGREYSHRPCGSSSPAAPASSAPTSSTRCSTTATTCASSMRSRRRCIRARPTTSTTARRAASAATSPTRRPCAPRSRTVDAVCHQAAKVGLGLDIGDITVVRHRQRPRDRGAAARARARPLHRPARARLAAWSSTARATTSAPTTARVSPPPALAPRISTLGRFEPTCPDCGAPLTPRSIAESAPARSAQRLRGDQAPPGAPLLRVLPGDRGARHRAALPQRLRAADAARHAVCGGRVDLRQRARVRAARRACSRTGASCGTSSTSATSRGRTCSR